MTDTKILKILKEYNVECMEEISKAQKYDTTPEELCVMMAKCLVIGEILNKITNEFITR